MHTAVNDAVGAFTPPSMMFSFDHPLYILYTRHSSGREYTNRMATTAWNLQRPKTKAHLLAVLDVAAGEVDVILQDALPRPLCHKLLAGCWNSLYIKSNAPKVEQEGQ